jgi:nucleoside-diphosphate-sugar epimerase
MKKVLVVGGAGYVGCVLLEELLEKGYSVRVLDRLFFGHVPLREFQDRIELIEEDMRDVDESHVQDCAAVINIGGLSNDPTAEFNPRANDELNTRAAINLAQIAKEAGVSRLIFASTASIYDRGVGEDAQDVLLDEQAPVEPKAAYATSKLAAEQGILGLAGAGFAPVSFRQGTVFGFSPRMRYDLVLNTFVKDALSRGRLFVFYGGSMWRPLIDVRDVARAYVATLEAEPQLIRGEIFNLAAGNFRISELALKAQQVLRAQGIPTEVEVDYSYRMVRSYRISSEKAWRVLGFRPQVTVQESIVHMVKEIERRGYTDFSHPRYYNIEWMKMLEEVVGIVSRHGYVLSKPEWKEGVGSSRDDVTQIHPGRVRPAG